MFLVIVLSYFLLRSEQKLPKDKRDPNFLKVILRFNTISILFVLLVGGFGLLQLMITPTPSEPSAKCSESIERMIKLADSPQQSVETLRALIKNSTNACLEQEVNDE